MTTVREYITNNIEDTEPQGKILEWLRTIDDKQINKTHIQKLRDHIGDQSITLRKAYGMAQIEWGDYRNRKDGDGGSLLIAYREKNIAIDVAWIEENNGAMFSGLRLRNKSRLAVLERGTLCEELDEAIADYRLAKERLDNLLGSDCFRHDCTSIRTELVEANDA